ncbi:C6 zinc finger, variant 2 [Purpureocillium takamizusanense]|nr:C6 zinc finger, variant 2 [Purpureocillium takamizusanense]UNI23798.1 C6 zinc finger, variant 2 [Purpureocillium takamizusanense]
MFQWPLLSVNGGHRFMPGNILAADHLQPPAQAGSPSTGVPLLDGEEITALLTRFLRLVHVMNPVLDCTTLMTYGRAVAELGPQWDAKTCLVLLAAALGAIARPFGPGAETPASLGDSMSQHEDTQARQKAESYYQYAKRRFGVLGRSLTACQCHFLSGTYLLHTLRPVEAWQSMFQASSLYTVYLKSRAAAQMVGDGHCHEDALVGDTHCTDEELRCCLEQRLFWSCIKAESELCAEVELPRSGLHSIDYPYQFPSPPTPKSVDGLNDSEPPSMPGSSTRTGTANSSPGGVGATQDFKELHEHSWFYYLSEISLLRLSSRVNHAFYVEPPASWARMNLLTMMTTAWDFEAQLRQWQAGLPAAICCFDVPDRAAAASSTTTTVTRLQLATWSRCASIKLRLYRPFLYRFALMHEQDWPLRDALRALAERAVRLSLDALFSVGLRHRHAGAWFKCRETAARALVIVCATRIGLVEEMGCAGRARDALDLCLAHLRYWEGEAGDVRLARRTLQDHVLTS